MTTKLKLLIEINLENYPIDDKESYDCMVNDILFNNNKGSELILHSNEIGDELGIVKVLEVVK